MNVLSGGGNAVLSIYIHLLSKRIAKFENLRRTRFSDNYRSSMGGPSYNIIHDVLMYII